MVRWSVMAPSCAHLITSQGFAREACNAAVLATNNTGVEPALHVLLRETGQDEDDVRFQCHAFHGTHTHQQGPSASGSGLVWGVASKTVVAPSDEVVVGVPSGSSLVVQPDGAQAPATCIGVSGECKIVLVVADELGMSPGKMAAQCSHATLGLYRALLLSKAAWLDAWEAQGEKTVVLRGESVELLDALQAHATSLQLPTYMVEDAGRTEVAPNSRTVLAIGGLSDMVDMVTGHLHTLR